MGWFLSLAAFFSGCLPIALINGFLNWNNNILIIRYFSWLFCSIAIVATLYFLSWLKKNNNVKNSDLIIIENIKRKNIFSTGAMSYYIVPFVSFIPGEDLKTFYILVTLIIMFAWLYVSNRMALYTPIIDFSGYKILEATISNGSEKKIRADVLIKNIDNIYFSDENRVNARKIDENTYFAYHQFSQQ